MIERGYENVKFVHSESGEGGGTAMEKYFEFYRDGKVINPTTGKVIVVRP
jgi:hypothetical protein